MSLLGQPCQSPLFLALAGSEPTGWSMRRKSGTAPSGVVAVFEARDDPHRRLVVMVCQVFDGGVLALVARRVGARRRRARRVARADVLVVEAGIIDLHLLLHLGVLDDEEAQALGVAA